MDNKLRKKVTRKNLSIKTRHDRLISEYVKVKYPEAYMEAEEYYVRLNQIYPNKRDLCKTIEFLRITTEFKTLNDFYHRNKPSKVKRKKQTVDNMLLEIPLLNHNTLTSNRTEEVNVHVNESPLVLPDSLYEDLVREIRSDPDMYSIFNDMNISQEHQAIVETIPEVENIPGEEHSVTVETIPEVENIPGEEHSVTVETIPEVENIPGEEHSVTVETIPEVENIPGEEHSVIVENIPEVENITEFIQELCEDPDLYKIFNSMDIDEQTPLERELTALGY